MKMVIRMGRKERDELTGCWIVSVELVEGRTVVNVSGGVVEGKGERVGLLGDEKGVE